jgi:hypothetical protein
MRKSEQRTKVAVLRSVIGLSAQDFADLIGRKFDTVRSLESGRLKLSPKLASRIGIETDVDMVWLLDDETTGPPFDQRGAYMTKEGFERYRAVVLLRDEKVTPEEMERRAIFQGELLRYMLLAIRDPQHYSLANYLAARFLRELRRRFNISDQLEDLKKKATGSKKKEPETVEELARTWQAMIARSSTTAESVEELARLLQGKLEALQGRGEHTSSRFGREISPAKAAGSKKKRP